MASHIPLFYRVMFLYIDPLICVWGIYLMFFDPSTYLENGIPSSLSSQLTSSSRNSPIIEHLVTSIGIYSTCIFALQVLLLYQFKDAPNGLNVKLWKILMFAILLVDVGLLYSGYAVNPNAFLDLKTWTSGDWGNNGILGFLAIMRMTFILGIGGVGREV